MPNTSQKRWTPPAKSSIKNNTSQKRWTPPAKSSIKNKSAIIKVFKESNEYTPTRILEIKKDFNYYVDYGTGIGNEYARFVNKPEGHIYHTRKSIETFLDKFSHTLQEILNEMPEYKAMIKEQESKKYWMEECKELDSYLYQYNYARYAYDSNEYQVNQSRAAYVGMVNHLITHFKNESSKFFEELYYTLKNKKFEIQTTGSESISTYTHISSWSFWAYGWVMINGEKFNFDKVSYRDSIHNRV